MRMLALCKYGRLGASSRIRTLQYQPYFESAGIDVVYVSLLDDQYLAARYRREPVGQGKYVRAYIRRILDSLRARRFDLVWIEYELLPYLPAWVERFLLGGAPYVLDYDDAVFHNYDQHASSIVRLILGQKIDTLMRRAKLVVAGNPYLRDRALRAGAQWVEIVPSVIDLDLYGPCTQPASSPFVIGWIGSPGSERLLESIRNPLQELAADPQFRLALIGATDHAMTGIPHETWKWSADSEVAALRRITVGIMPLENSPWEQGKCGFKLIQYMGVGRPVVASPVGINTSIIDHGSTGFLADTPRDWIESIRAIHHDPRLAAAMGANGREKVQREYSLQVTGPRLADLLRRAARAAG